MQNNLNPNFIIQQLMKNPNLANNQLAQNALQMYPGLEAVFSGGVASNSLLRTVMAPLNPIFADPKFSTDNAMGVAVLAHRMTEV